MSNGPYRYQNGNKYVFAGDGRWWLVSYSRGGDDYGYPVGDTHYGHHSRHHPPPLPAHSHLRHPINLPSRRVGTAGAEDFDDLRIRQLAIAINNQAGWVGTWQGVGGFYGASLAGALAALYAPALLNRTLLGPFEGRIFWSGFRFGALKEAEAYAAMGAGRVISASGVGVLLNRFGNGQVQDFLWGFLSRAWAYGAVGPVDAFIAEPPGPVWQQIELPILWAREGPIRLLIPATPITYHFW